MTDHHIEMVVCPKCGQVQNANVEHTVPFDSYAHECACGYWITESEWEMTTALKGQRVRKIGGSFQHTGVIVAEFVTTAGQPRIVLEFDAPVAGMLHVYRPDQVEIIDG